LRCVAGDFAGNTLKLGTEPLVIGRLPERANLVIPSPHISGAHTRLTPEPGAGRVWIEDLGSRNGTYVSKAESPPKWTQVHGGQALVTGDRFYLCDEQLAMFEIVEC
jgi:pSer/pThr/pTyr-binding forkhead associated (FHA) protein